MSMNKEHLIGRYNWLQRVITYPMPDWDKKTKMDFYYEFMGFVDTVKDCGYEFVSHMKREGDHHISVATDVVPIEKGELNERLGMI